MIMSMFGCTSVEDVKIPENGSSFFKPEEGTTKIRFLAGPLIYYISQEFDDEKKPLGEKLFYADGDELAKKDKNAKITFSYIIYDYADEEVKQWDISTKKLLKTVKALNGLNPDLSLMDCNVTKTKGSNGFNEYALVSGQNKDFTIKKVIENWKEEDPFEKMVNFINSKIEETIEIKKINKLNSEIEIKQDAEVIFTDKEALGQEFANKKQNPFGE